MIPDYLAERKHLQTLPLNVLADSRLGIDAHFYLKQLTDNPPSREPLVAATGGLPLALTQRIEADLRTLEKLRIKPVFVFPGLLPAKRWKQQQQHHIEWEEACKARREAWAKYEGGQEEAASKLFEGRSGLQPWDLWRMVLRIFRHRNVEFLVAPYVGWAQVRILFLPDPVRETPLTHIEAHLPSKTPKVIYPCHFWSDRYTSLPRRRQTDHLS